MQACAGPEGQPAGGLKHLAERHSRQAGRQAGNCCAGGPITSSSLLHRFLLAHFSASRLRKATKTVGETLVAGNAGRRPPPGGTLVPGCQQLPSCSSLAATHPVSRGDRSQSSGVVQGQGWRATKTAQPTDLTGLGSTATTTFRGMVGWIWKPGNGAAGAGGAENVQRPNPSCLGRARCGKVAVECSENRRRTTECACVPAALLPPLPSR